MRYRNNYLLFYSSRLRVNSSESSSSLSHYPFCVRNNAQLYRKPHRVNIRAFKAPVFFLWELLGYGTPRELSEKGIKRVWMASFRSSPGEYLEECLSLLRDYKVPISEYDGGTRLRQTLINFYADMMEMYEC